MQEGGRRFRPTETVGPEGGLLLCEAWKMPVPYQLPFSYRSPSLDDATQEEAMVQHPWLHIGMRRRLCLNMPFPQAQRGKSSEPQGAGEEVGWCVRNLIITYQAVKGSLWGLWANTVPGLESVMLLNHVYRRCRKQSTCVGKGNSQPAAGNHNHSWQLGLYLPLRK